MTSPATTPPRPMAPALVDLDDPRATDPGLTGGKASALARARSGGLRTMDGFVLTTAFAAGVDRGTAVEQVAPDVKERWRSLTDGGARSLVVRSSSTVEDQDTESMAGQFTTVVDVAGWDDFLAAVAAVLDSRAAAARASPSIRPDAPLGVLVQPYLHPLAGGVVFAADPVTGRSDRVVVSAVQGDPDRLVSGEVRATEYELTLDGTLIDRADAPEGARLTRSQLRALAQLVREASDYFGRPQDVEWAITDDDTVVLLQSRPLTTEIRGIPEGPVLGSGPVAETFPEPLRRLELDLWVPPLRDAVRTALSLAGTASPAELDASPLVTDVDGTVVVDLELFGEAAMHRGFGSRVAARLRRVRASWRVGRLRSALPALDGHLLRRIDSLLATVPSMPELTTRQLLALLERSRDALRSLHGHEILTSLLVDPHAPRLTASSVALRTLTHARERGETDDVIVAEHPVVLSLAPPSIGHRPRLPQCATPPELPMEGDGGRAPVLREALRLRVRWVQELMARAAWEVGGRLVDDGAIADRDDVAHLRLRDLHLVGTGRAVPTGLVHEVHAQAEQVAARTPMPARFQLSDRGLPIPVVSRSRGGGGIGAGGGTGHGAVTHDADDPAAGSVLVVETLSPTLAGVLHRLSGLVCETGSVLAHTAILAREAGVATVVGYRDAVARLPEGQAVTVDGTSGLVELDGERQGKGTPS